MAQEPNHVVGCVNVKCVQAEPAAASEKKSASAVDPAAASISDSVCVICDAQNLPHTICSPLFCFYSAAILTGPTSAPSSCLP